METKKFYVIEHENVGPNANPLNLHYVIQSIPGVTNSSHEILVDGWLGTTNDNAEYARGVYDTIDQAREFISKSAPGFTADTETDFYNDVIIEMWQDCREVWNVGDWLYDGVKGEINAHTTDQEIKILAADYAKLAESENIYLDGDVEDYLVDFRENLIEEEALLDFRARLIEKEE